MRCFVRSSFVLQVLVFSTALPCLLLNPCWGANSRCGDEKSTGWFSHVEPCASVPWEGDFAPETSPGTAIDGFYACPGGPGSPGISQANGSPPLGTFGRQLLRNFKGIVSKDNLWPLAIGSAATGLSAVWDDNVQSYFGEERRFRVLGEVGDFIGNGGFIGAVSGGMLLWSYQTENHHFRSMAYSLTQGFIVNVGVTMGMKAVVRRERPSGENRLSFPSGHTSAAFTSAAVVAHYYPKTALPAYATAGIVGLSRIEKNKHWLTDVVSGATVGMIVGRTVISGSDTLRLGRVTFWPAAAPGGGIAVLAVIPVE